MRMENKAVLISGAGSGIGEASAKTYAREGASVLCVDINDEGGSRVAEEIVKGGGKAEFLHADAGNTDDIEKMVARMVELFGRIDVLHNNAVYTTAGRIGELDLAEWRKTMDFSLTGYWYASKLAIARMLEQGGGAIVNTASVSGLGGDYGLGAYNVVKAGVVNMTRVIGIEYARRNIRCNAVCPGPIGTPPLQRFKQADPDRIGRIEDTIPMGRLGTAQEIANVALFLASDEASFVTGAFFVADGGLWAHTGMPAMIGDGPRW